MLTVTHIIEVEVFYDIDDTELIELDIKAKGACKLVDGNDMLERYSVDLKWDSVTWDKDDFSTTANKAIANYINSK